MLALVSVVAVAGLTVLGNSLQNFYDQANNIFDPSAKAKLHGHCGHKVCKP